MLLFPSGTRKFFVLSLLLLSGCAGKPVTEQDMLYYEAYGAEAQGADTIVVFLHGDSGRGGTPGLAGRYMFRAAERFARKHAGEAIGIGLLRPGYRDRRGNRSPGTPSQIDDDKTQRKNAVVAYAVARLKSEYGATRVLGVGHSGGAMMLGAIIGQKPELFDAVVLVSTACSIPEYRRHRSGRNTWIGSQSPKDFAGSISPDIIIRAIVGENDNNTLPHYSKDCVDLYKKRGADAEVIIVKGAGRNRGLRAVVEEHLDALLLEGDPE